MAIICVLPMKLFLVVPKFHSLTMQTNYRWLLLLVVIFIRTTILQKNLWGSSYFLAWAALAQVAVVLGMLAVGAELMLALVAR